MLGPITVSTDAIIWHELTCVGPSPEVTCTKPKLRCDTSMHTENLEVGLHFVHKAGDSDAGQIYHFLAGAMS